MSTETLTLASGRQVRAELRAGLSDHRLRLVASVVLLITGAAAALVTPRLMGQIVDLVASGRPVLGTTGAAAVWWSGAAMAASTLASVLLGAAGFVLMAGSVDRVLARLREQVISRGLALPVSRIERVGVGDLVTRTTDDVALLTQAVNESLPTVTGAGFAVAVTLVGMATLDWRFAAVFLLLLPIYASALLMYRRHAPEKYLAERHERGARAAEVLSTLRGVRTVRAYGLQESRRTRIARHSWQVVRLSIAIRIVNNRLFGRVNLAEWVGMSLLLVVGVVLVRDGQVTVGAVTTATLFFLRLFGPIGQLLFVIDPLSSAVASLRRVVGVLVEGEESASIHGTSAPTSSISGHGLTLRGLHAGYDGREVLGGIDTTVPAGSTVAVVGASGAGKSTLAAVIAGLLPPTAGEVDLGGVDAATLDPRTRSQLIALVTQEGHVFAGPLRDDLTLARPDADDAAIRSALDTVRATDWVDALPEGLDTVVGAHGHAVTPVQAQQLALARIALADPPVVVLDEATAEAGSAGAATLEEAAAAVTRGRTALIVVHRLDQAARADRVLFLADGRVSEEGTHQELVAADGEYSAAWRAWTRRR